MEHDLLVEVIRKTARKMSDRGLELVGSIPLGEAEQHPARRGSRRLTVARPSDKNRPNDLLCTH